MLVNDKIDKVYRVKLLITQANYIIPNFFPEEGQLTGKIITGLSIDIAPPRNPPLQFNFPANDVTVKTPTGAAAVNTAESLSYMYLTLYNTNEEIIFDSTPLNLFSGYNSNYPQPGAGVRNSKKQIIPMNTPINIRQSFVKGTPGFTLFNSIISFNFYYK
jgi:hypothetical protein